MIRRSLLIDENRTLFGVKVNSKKNTERKSALFADQAITDSLVIQNLRVTGYAEDESWGSRLESDYRISSEEAKIFRDRRGAKNAEIGESIC